MRQFIVLGFSSNSKSEAGESLYLGGDRGEAIAVANKPEASYARKEVYELATPHLRRHFESEPTEEKKTTPKKAASTKK